MRFKSKSKKKKTIISVAVRLQPEIQIRGTEAVLRHPVFSFLDYRDLVKSVYKLCRRLAGEATSVEGGKRKKFN